MIPETPRLLYIDDDDGLRRLAERALTRRGFAVTTAANGVDGVTAARDGGFDVIAVDHYMPGQDGLETLAQLTALPDPPPVVYVTGSEESRIAVAALKAGAVDYVVKTIGDGFYDLFASALNQAIERVVHRRGRLRAEAALVESNARLEALLKEVNHRVANSLQLVSAFIRLQAQALPSEDAAARAALDDTQRRVQAIGQVHRRLYTSDDVESVDMEQYLTALIDELTATWSTGVAERRMTLTSDAVRLPTDKAVSLGVIVSELVSNACKYAYAPDQPGEIRVDLRHDDPGFYRLRVEDDGRGLPDGGVVQGTGVGTKLIAAMAKSLRSAVEIDGTGRGLRATLRGAVR